MIVKLMSQAKGPINMAHSDSIIADHSKNDPFSLQKLLTDPPILQGFDLKNTVVCFKELYHYWRNWWPPK